MADVAPHYHVEHVVFNRLAVYVDHPCREEHALRNDIVYVLTPEERDAMTDFNDNHGWWCYNRRPDPDEVTP